MTLFKKHDETRNNVLSYHCIIHQENLASLHTEMFEEVMKDIVDIINFIRSHALNHRQFRELLNDYDAHYNELVYHSQVRWLSKGAVIDHFFHLIEPIKIYLCERNALPNKISNILQKFDNLEWIENVAFLADITGHLNDLNLKLQGKNKIISDTFTNVISSQNKLLLFLIQLKSGEFTHFQRLQYLKEKKLILKQQELHTKCIEDLLNEFENRFSDFRAQKRTFSLVSDPWIILQEELSEITPYITNEIWPNAKWS